MAEALQECLSRFPKIDTLKAEQSEALEALISGRDVIAILPTGFGKSLIFQLFCEVKLASNPNTCILVVAPLNSIVQDQIDELTELGFTAVHLRENNPEYMKDIAGGKFNFIFCCAERCLSHEFQSLLKSSDKSNVMWQIRTLKTSSN